MIRVVNLTFRYNLGPLLFDRFNWRVSRGEHWVVFGPSGAGKTTLLRLLAGLELPSNGAGTVEIDGQRLESPRAKTGFVLEDSGLLTWATIRDNVSLGLRVRKFRHARELLRISDWQLTPDEKKLTETWLQLTHTLAVADKHPQQVSAGQKQLTALASALILEPDLLLLDDPFRSLDAPTKGEMQNMLLDLRRGPGRGPLLGAGHVETSVHVTHDLAEVTKMGSKILFLGLEQPVEISGSGEDLLQQLGTLIQKAAARRDRPHKGRLIGSDAGKPTEEAD